MADGYEVEAELPDEAIDAVGMLSFRERQMLYCFARDYWDGQGKIVDAGSFMGSSTASLAAGVAARGVRPEGVIHAYEMGYLPPSPSGQEIIREFNGVKYRHGDTFVPILRGSIKPFWSLVELHLGDIMDYQWPGEEIGLCFIDVCKTPRLNAFVSKNFYPHIPVGGYLINQDYFFDRLPFVKVTMGYLDEYFEWVGRVCTSSIWRCIKPVPQEIADYDPYTADDPKMVDYHRKAIPPGLQPDADFLMDLSLVYLRGGEGLDELDSKHAEFIEYNARRWDNKSGKRRDAQFRLERARAELA